MRFHEMLATVLRQSLLLLVVFGSGGAAGGNLWQPVVIILLCLSRAPYQRSHFSQNKVDTGNHHSIKIHSLLINPVCWMPIISRIYFTIAIVRPTNSALKKTTSKLRVCVSSGKIYHLRSHELSDGIYVHSKFGTFEFLVNTNVFRNISGTGGFFDDVRAFVFSR